MTEHATLAPAGPPPGALAEQLGDQAHALLGVLLGSEGTFDAAAHPSSAFTVLLQRIVELRGVLDALAPAAQTALAEATRREERDAQAAEDPLPRSAVDRAAQQAAAREVSMITRQAPARATWSLAASPRPVRALPSIHEAVAVGGISGEAALRVATAVRVLDEDGRAEVDRVLAQRLPYLDAASVQQWEDEVAAAVEAVDPEGAARRHHLARQRRHLRVRQGQDGMSTVTLHVPAIDGALIGKRYRLEAERRRAAGERRGHGVLMADLASTALLGGTAPVGEPSEAAEEEQAAPAPAPPQVTLEIGVLITERTLIAPESGDVAHLEGYGAVPAEAVREQIRRALEPPGPQEADPFGVDGATVRTVFRRLFTHPSTGELIAADARSRAFPPAMRRFLTWRDATCRGPFCDAPIRHMDHIRRHADGGATSLDDGQSGCAHCNLGKDGDTRSVERVEDELPGHRVAWSSRNGVVRVTGPRALTAAADAGDGPDPAPDPDPAVPDPPEQPLSEEPPPAPPATPPPAPPPASAPDG